MDNKTLNDKLKMRAVQLGLCAQWTSEWSDSETQDELVKKYKRGIDFCIEHNYPNNEFIKSNFSRDVLLRNLVFVDEVLDLDGGNGIYILNGITNGHIRFTDYAFATIYVRHSCNITIECSGLSKVFVTMLDESSVNISQTDAAKCYVCQKSVNGTLLTQGEVLVRRS